KSPHQLPLVTIQRTGAAVCARAARLAHVRIAEVAQDRGSETRAGLGILHHSPGLRVLECPPALGFLRIEGAGGSAMRRVVLSWSVDEKPPDLDVGIIPQQRCRGGTAVAAGAADFLVVRLD